MTTPKKKGLFSEFFRFILPSINVGDDNVIERVESLKSKVVDEYSEIKQPQVQEFLDVAEQVYSESTTKKLERLAEKTVNQIEETKLDLDVTDEYLQSTVDLIGRQKNVR